MGYLGKNNTIFYQRALMAFFCFLYNVLYMALCNYYVGDNPMADDAYYYCIIAKNIVSHGLSTFDGQTLSNGYHPLWMAILVLQYLTVGDSAYITYLIEIALVSFSVYLLLTSIGEKSLSFASIFTILFVLLTKSMVATGMESSLWIFCFSLLVFVSREPNSDNLTRAAAIGVMITLAIGARIDSAVFVIPFGFLVLPGFRDKAVAFAIVGAGAALYCGWNYETFGVPVPLSGAVKSLGGFQINHRLLDYLAFWEVDHRLWMAPIHMWQTRYWISIILFGLALVFLPVSPRNSVTRRLLTAYSIGFVLYAVKLALFSSWRLWPWYNFPVIIGVAGVVHAAFLLFSRKRLRLPPSLERPTIAAGVVVLLVIVAGSLTRMAAPLMRFDKINKMALSKYEDILKGNRIAMGDRAGSMAYFYNGPLTQLEGLVNDQEYFRTLSSNGDVQDLLCKRGVRYFLSFTADLGNYQNVDIPVLRPFLTQFSGPSLHVSRDQQVGRVFDLRIFAEAESGENYLYIWRLGCPAPRAS